MFRLSDTALSHAKKLYAPLITIWDALFYDNKIDSFRETALETDKEARLVETDIVSGGQMNNVDKI